MQQLGPIVVLTLELSEEAVEDVIAYPQRFASRLRALEKATRSRFSVAGDELKIVIVGHAAILQEGVKAIDAARHFGTIASEHLGHEFQLAEMNGLRLVRRLAA